MRQAMAQWYARWRESIERARRWWAVDFSGWWRSCRYSPPKVAVKSSPRLATTNFRAAAIVPCADACEDARRLGARRFLARSAPLLPLRQCTQSDQCDCTYRKFSDRRRDPDRRRAMFAGSGRADRRRRAHGRRASDMR